MNESQAVSGLPTVKRHCPACQKEFYIARFHAENPKPEELPFTCSDECQKLLDSVTQGIKTRLQIRYNGRQYFYRVENQVAQVIPDEWIPR
jgi:hypothetical protein